MRLAFKSCTLLYFAIFILFIPLDSISFCYSSKFPFPVLSHLNPYCTPSHRCTECPVPYHTFTMYCTELELWFPVTVLCTVQYSFIFHLSQIMARQKVSRQDFRRGWIFPLPILFRFPNNVTAMILTNSDFTVGSKLWATPTNCTQHSQLATALTAAAWAAWLIAYCT